MNPPYRTENVTFVYVSKNRPRHLIGMWTHRPTTSSLSASAHEISIDATVLPSRNGLRWELTLLIGDDVIMHSGAECVSLNYAQAQVLIAAQDVLLAYDHE
jgi:hypothetical protein